VLEKLKNISALSNFGKKSSTMLGVDISTTAVKILQLSPSGNSYKLDNYIIRPLPANSVVEKNISDIDAVGDCIAQAISILKPSLKDAAVAVAGSAVITKTIEMNASLSDSEMENQIVVEADQYIPYIGRMFKRTASANCRTELLIFITPKIITEINVR
tara:strand:- start:2715 stop:3191 length:477 start_codon:yes stop_codon:yes gene_type:complete